MSMKEAYLDKVRAQLAEWHIRIEQYRDLVVNATDVQAQRMLKRLEDSYELACCQLETLRNTPGNAWESAKEGLEHAMVDLKRILDDSGAGRTGQNLAVQSSRAHAFAPFPRRA